MDITGIETLYKTETGWLNVNKSDSSFKLRKKGDTYEKAWQKFLTKKVYFPLFS